SSCLSDPADPGRPVRTVSPPVRTGRNRDHPARQAPSGVADDRRASRFLHRGRPRRHGGGPACRSAVAARRGRRLPVAAPPAVTAALRTTTGPAPATDGTAPGGISLRATAGPRTLRSPASPWPYRARAPAAVGTGRARWAPGCSAPPARRAYAERAGRMDVLVTAPGDPRTRGCRAVTIRPSGVSCRRCGNPFASVTHAVRPLLPPACRQVPSVCRCLVFHSRARTHILIPRGG